EFLQQNNSRIGFRGPCIWQRPRVLRRERRPFGGEGHRLASGPFLLLLSKEIDDWIAGDLKHSSAPPLHRVPQTKGLDDFDETLLKKILRVGLVAHPFADEIEKPRPCFRHDFGDLTVSLGHPSDA